MTRRLYNCQSTFTRLWCLLEIHKDHAVYIKLLVHVSQQWTCIYYTNAAPCSKNALSALKLHTAIWLLAVRKQTALRIGNGDVEATGSGATLHARCTTNGMCTKNSILRLWCEQAVIEHDVWFLLLLAATVWSFAHLSFDRNREVKWMLKWISNTPYFTYRTLHLTILIQIMQNRSLSAAKGLKTKSI